VTADAFIDLDTRDLPTAGREPAPELAAPGPDDGIPAEVWSLPTEELAAAFERSAAAAPELLLSDGPVPADIPLGNLGEARAAFAAHRAR
jgi:hypothetical protein